MTNIIHNEFFDNLLKITNCFLIIKISYVLVKQLLRTVFEICNP